MAASFQTITFICNYKMNFLLNHVIVLIRVKISVREPALYEAGSIFYCNQFSDYSHFFYSTFNYTMYKIFTEVVLA